MQRAHTVTTVCALLFLLRLHREHWPCTRPLRALPTLRTLEILSIDGTVDFNEPTVAAPNARINDGTLARSEPAVGISRAPEEYAVVATAFALNDVALTALRATQSQWHRTRLSADGIVR